MDKNLIKIEGIYNNLKSGEEFNIFCTMLVDFNDFNNILINIKNCEINQEDNNNENLIKFNEENFNIEHDLIIINTLNNIKILLNNNFEGEINIYLQNLIKFLFQYIYNEYYIEGNMTFETIKVIKE